MGDRRAKARTIIDRAQELGARIALDAATGRITIANRAKLPAAADEPIREYAKEIADLLREEAQAEIEERAAIIEHDGGVSKPIADQFARLLTANRPADVEPADWNWFVGKAAEVIDRRAA